MRTVVALWLLWGADGFVTRWCARSRTGGALRSTSPNFDGLGAPPINFGQALQSKLALEEYDDTPMTADGYPLTCAPCCIKVIGVGGGGGNAVNRMVECVRSVPKSLRADTIFTT